MSQLSQITKVYANAKLTLTLEVLGQRPDKMHEICSEMVTVNLSDELLINPLGDGLKISGVYKEQLIDTPQKENLITKALKAVNKKAFVCVDKNIPVKAGLGGGSADAAAILRWANVKDEKLAASLGADIPFCMIGGRAKVKGIGEIVESLAFKKREFVLFLLPFGIETKLVYEAYDEGYKSLGQNALETAAFKVEPRLKAWSDYLKGLTGQRPKLAGSGSTLFYDDNANALGFNQGIEGPFGRAKVIDVTTIDAYSY